MEAITQLVAESLARHGFDRPVDPRRLQWSRWFRCDSPHSLLVVPSKPGIFALSEEVMDLGTSTAPVGTDAFVRPAELSSAAAPSATTLAGSTVREGHGFSSEPDLSKRSASKGAVSGAKAYPALAAPGIADGTQTSDAAPRRMLAVLQFAEDDDMAFTLDRMFTRINPMRARLASGKCFLRFVVIEDQTQRRNICAALNQWMSNSAEKATGLPSDFSSSVELATDRVGRAPSPAIAESAQPSAVTTKSAPLPFPAAPLNSGAAKNLHCPQPLPSGF
jgi:hypothetical protein